jgi:TRAP-type C4-dicarboxylate transport system permease small subunit
MLGQYCGNLANAFFTIDERQSLRRGKIMESVFEELRLAARRLLGLRAGLCAIAVAIYGYLLGSTLSNGAALDDLAKLVLLGVVTIGGASFAMRSTEIYAEHQRKKKLDALYGRDS